MAHEMESQGSGTGEAWRLSYNPLHDYRRIDTDAWAEQWFSEVPNMDLQSDEYQALGQIVARQLHLHPDYRDTDVVDMEEGMSILRMFGVPNPYNPASESAEEQQLHQQHEQITRYAGSLARHIVRATVEDAEGYAAIRVEQEHSGTDFLTGVLSRRGLARSLQEQYGITGDPVRRDPSGKPLPAVKLTYLYADANEFKWFNDTLGYQVGDAAIVEVAWRAKDFLRRSEAPIIHRIGGDEFGAILGGLGDHELEQLTRRIMERQLDRVIDPKFHYRESMAAVQAALQAAKADGRKVRAEARMMQLTKADLVSGKRPHYTLYINGEPVTELRNLIILSVGVASALVSADEGVQQLRRSAEADMKRVKPILQAVIDEELMVAHKRR